MALAEKPAKITVDLGSRELYRRLRVAAIEEDRTVRDVVIEAVSYWLDHREEVEDELAAGLLEHRLENPSGPRRTLDEVRSDLALHD